VTADAEFTKHNLSRMQASLPNGYCGRPPQQACPHPTPLYPGKPNWDLLATITPR
jgi:hypothetical protein